MQMLYLTNKGFKITMICMLKKYKENSNIDKKRLGTFKNILKINIAFETLEINEFLTAYWPQKKQKLMTWATDEWKKKSKANHIPKNNFKKDVYERSVGHM